ncbi:hypothetical protein [Streptomyces sp. NPDC054794]
MAAADEDAEHPDGDGKRRATAVDGRLPEALLRHFAERLADEAPDDAMESAATAPDALPPTP